MRVILVSMRLESTYNIFLPSLSVWIRYSFASNKLWESFLAESSILCTTGFSFISGSLSERQALLSFDDVVWDSRYNPYYNIPFNYFSIHDKLMIA